ncbi:low molecular weight protein-tyrosine-phosphatase [Arsukibacterium indicum]|uniref:protein-tyrosine-phosphatase n=1 Tax=Arsukibacterium indicum TaxID=2848612 RepID=A0ABS6MM61_9GAMM|nr:low molecular weight protein-tyrosine-phosphatase [Arsukibacterium indicum]MBV2129909.1 low molecular weight phosphotyrosine protein phosphatase [Arsukibacterium indicum]
MRVKKILVVCLGNICRSPTAHAILRHKAQLKSLDIEIDSAGTSASHKGEPPDSRSIKAGSARGYHFNDLYSRPVFDHDFANFDLILAMDNDNLAELNRRCPAEFAHKVKLFLSFHPEYPTISEVPDPYYSGSKGFELVLDLIERACDNLVSAPEITGR